MGLRKLEKALKIMARFLKFQHVELPGGVLLGGVAAT